ncbi:MAG: PAS domain S-box protein [Bacteroidota bacterium]|jgi:PAS domain S-box-containing protein
MAAKTPVKNVKTPRLHSGELLHILYTQSSDGIFLSDERGRCIDVNPRGCEILGRRRNEILRRPVWDLLVSEEITRITAGARPLRSKKMFRVNAQLVQKNGTTVPVEICTSPYARKNSVVTVRVIAEQKEVELLLKDSRERYRLILSVASDYMYSTKLERDGKLHLNWVAGAFKKITGYTFQEYVGAGGWRALLHPDDIPKDDADMETLHRNTPVVTELRTFNKKRETVWVRVYAHPVWDNHHQMLVGIYGAVQNITERRKAELALRASEAQLSNALKIAQLGHWEYDVVNDLFTFNDHFYQMLHTSIGRVKKYALSSAEYIKRFVHPHDAGFVREEIQKAINGSDPDYSRRLEHRIMYDNGEVGYIAVQLFVAKNSRGKTIKTYGVNQNITERKLNENKLLLLAQTIQSISEAVTITDLDDRLLYVNDAFVRIYGYSAEEVMGKEIGFLWSPNNPPGLLREILTGSRAGVWSGEILNLTKTGREFPILLKTSQVRDKNGAIIGLVGIAEDISEKKKAEREIQKRTDDLTLMNTLNSAVNRGEDFNSIMNLLRSQLTGLFPCTGINLFLIDQDGKTFTMPEVVLASGTLKKIERLIGMPIPRIRFVPAPDSFFYELLRNKRGTVVTDPAIIRRWITEFIEFFPLPKIVQSALRKLVPQIQQLLNFKFIFSIPLISENATIGTLDITGQQLLTEDDLHRIRNISAQLTAALARRQADETVRKSEKKYRSIFENVQDVYYEILLDGTILEVSPSIQTFSSGEYCREDLIGKSIYEFYASQTDRDDLLTALQKTGSVSDYEIRLKNRDGSIIFCLLSAKISSVPGEQMEKIIGSLHDITERKRAEEALHESEEKFSKIFHSSPVPISINNIENGRYTDVNEAFLDHVGYSRGEVVGRNALDLNIWVHPEERKRLLDIVDRNGSVENFEAQFRTKSGTIGTSLLFREKIELNGEQFVIGTTFDITERKAVEEQIRRWNEELEQRVADRTAQLENANKELESFAYSISHDLRAPLRAIDGYAKIFADRYRDLMDDEGKRLSGIIREQAQKMGRLIDDILSLSRLGRFEMQLVQIDMAALARAVFAEITTAEQKARIDIHIGSLPPAEGDATLMRQILVNVISNAVKFSSKKERPFIEINGNTGETEITYSIRDNGAGFDMRYADKMFGIFQRLHTIREFEGTGVGLAIVHRLVIRHGGRVWAEGEIGKGAVFYFTLPCK